MFLISRRFLTLALFAPALLALAVGCPAAELEAPGKTGPAPSAQDLKALAFDLAHAGEFGAARDTFARLAHMSGDPLARTAWFHLGNLLESSHVLDTQTAEELERTLEDAREAYARAVADMASAPPAARRQAEMNLQRVEEKLAGLRELAGGGFSPLEVSEGLDDLHAPEAAAQSLRSRLNPDDPGADQFYFLTLVYRVAWVDHLYLRLGNAWKLAERGGAEGPGAAAIDARVRQLDEVAGETEALGMTAIERYPASPHLLDLRILTADTHRYHAQLEMFRAVRGAGGAEAAAAAEAGAGAAPREVIEHLQSAIARLREASALVEAARHDPAILSPAQRAAWPPATLDLYAEQLRDSLAADEAQLRSMTEPGADAPVEAVGE